ncbi:MAG: hypothetical protein WBP55_01875 [Solirubrobacterales bacterium]
MRFRKITVGLLVILFGAFVLAGPANAGKPSSGFWFSEAADPANENNLSSIQFKVVGGKKLKKVTIYWQCGKKSGYHNFTNLPIPVGINRKKRFKLVGATTPPSGQSQKDFTLKGRFTSKKKANYSMKLQGCGTKTTGKLKYAGD